MKRLIAGGLALGLAGVGGALLASPGGAQEDPDIIQTLDASLTPTVVQGGGTITVSSTDPCPQPPEVESHVSEVAWAFGPTDWLGEDLSADPADILGEGTAPVSEDGSWEFTFQAPNAAGAYELYAVCVPDEMEDEMDEGLDPGAVEDLAAEAAEVAETLGDDHGETPPPDVSSSSSSSSSTTPSSVPEPEEPELAIFLYGPLDFTVQGAPAPATPIPQQPNFTG